MKTVSLFSGMGGMCLAAKRSGATVIWANEINKYACESYRLNLNPNVLVEGDISAIDPNSIPEHDMLMAGFPCQSFSVAGLRRGFDDQRGQLFFRIMDIVDAKNPEMILLENVKNLRKHDHGRTFRRITEEIEKRNYSWTCKILNTNSCGIPHNRERIFIVCSKKVLGRYEIPEPNTVGNGKIEDFIDYDGRQEDCFYLPKDNRYYHLFKKANMKRRVVYQLRRYYVRENKRNICPTLTANMGGGGHNVPFIKDSFGIRKLTPRECLRLQGFPDDYSFPDKMALSHIYTQIGNSVTVPLVEDIIASMMELKAGVYKKKKTSKTGIWIIPEIFADH